jgi:hypothetical protein
VPYPAPRYIVNRPTTAPPRFLATPNGVTNVYGPGSFAPDPSLIVITGPRQSYTPLGAVGDTASIAVFGPTSRFRTRVAEQEVYETSYNGSFVPAGTATFFTTPGLDPRTNTRQSFRLSDYSAPLPSRPTARGRTPLFPTGEN